MAEGAEALAAPYSSVTAFVDGLDERGFLRPTRCLGWSVQELLLHLLLDAQRALVVFAQPGADPPDTDAVSYWRAFDAVDREGAAAHATNVRRAALAYASPRGLVAQWTDTSSAALSAAAAADPSATVHTQGKVLTARDFVETLAVEAALHLLDLQPAGAPLPDAGALALVRRTVASLLGGDVPAGWDDATCALRLTGREPLTDDDRAALGAAADRVPVLA